MKSPPHKGLKVYPLRWQVWVDGVMLSYESLDGKDQFIVEKRHSADSI